MSKAETAAALRSVPLFSSCSGRQLRQIVNRGWEQRFEPGDDLCVQDELADEFYVLLEGTATVRRGGRKIGTLRAGDYFGEIALLRTLIERSRRTASVQADTAVRCFVLARSGFHDVLHVEDIAIKILRAVVPRMAATSDP